MHEKPKNKNNNFGLDKFSLIGFHWIINTYIFHLENMDWKIYITYIYV